MYIFCPFYALCFQISWRHRYKPGSISSFEFRLSLFMPPSRIWHALFLSCGGVLYRLHFLLRFSNCSAATVDPSHRHVGIIYVNRNSPAELSHACRHVYALHLFRVCGTSWGGKHVVRLTGHVDPFSLIDIAFPSSARKPFPSSIILILLSVFCGFSVFMLHSYRPLDWSWACLISQLRFHADPFSLDQR